MTRNSGLDDVPFGAGAVLGAAAYVLGYLATYLHSADAVRNAAFTRIMEFFSGEPTAWKVVGWLFYNEHFVAVLLPGLLGGSNSVNFLADAEGTTALLYLVPPLALGLAGAAVAVVSDSDDAVAGATAGAATVLGYLPLAVAGVFLFTVTLGGEPARPDLVTGVLLAGLVYPLVLGAVGGAAGAAVGDSASARGARD